MCTPRSAPHVRSRLSFGLRTGISSATPGMFTPFLPPSRALFLHRHVMLPSSLETPTTYAGPHASESIATRGTFPGP
eukprot:scaffold874_cov380-Prasinococcus_capsulatus_cf.AAC.21